MDELLRTRTPMDGQVESDDRPALPLGRLAVGIILNPIIRRRCERTPTSYRNCDKPVRTAEA